MKYLISLISILHCTLIFSQLEWVYQTGGSANSSFSEEDEAHAIVTDNFGNTYVTGSFDGNSDFDFGPSQFILSNTIGLDVFVVKLDPLGQLVWAKSFVGGDYGKGISIEVDNQQNVIVGGIFMGTFDFDPSSGTHFETSNGGIDAFVTKLDVNGNFLWVQTLGGNSSDRCNGVTVDINGNVYITGSFTNSVDFDLGPGTNIVSVAGAMDFYIVKFDSNGNWKWSNTYGSSGVDNGNSIKIDNNQNLYIAGEFSETIDFDKGPGVSNLTSSAELDGFILKIDTLGQHIWSKSFQCISSIYSYGLAIDQNSNCFLTGIFLGTMDANPSSNTNLLTSNGDWDIFTIALDSLGDFLWANSIGGNNGWDKSNGICTDNLNNIYITGYISQMVDFDPGIGTQYLNNTGDNAMFILKMDQNGNYLSAEIIGSETGKASGMGIVSDYLQNIIVCGSFREVLELEIGSSSAQLNCIDIQDAFVFKLNHTLSLTEENIYFSVGPNPFNEYLQFENNLSINLTLFLVNTFGQILETFLVTPGINKIDMSNYSKGIYFVLNKNAEKPVKLVKN